MANPQAERIASEEGPTGAMPGINGAPADVEAPRDSPRRSDLIDLYEAKLAKAEWGAWGVGALQNVCRFLAYCNLTWATVVLLGGSVSSLGSADFRVVTALLLLEAGRLGFAIFFSRLVRKALVKLSQNPPLLKREDIRPTLATALRALSQVGQTICISPSFALPIIRLRVLQHSSVHNLLFSLRIFYTLALMNASVGLAAVACSIVFLILLFEKTEQSIQGCYDEILQRTLESGIVQVQDFDFFDFAFKLLGKEFARNAQPLTVKKNYELLLNYMHAHRHGVDFLQAYLDRSDEVFVQQAAANMVGFWADQNQSVKWLPKSLLTKLADKLGPGQVGWAAANSFNAVAKIDARLVLQTESSDKTTVLAILMEMVDHSSSRCLVCVRALISLVDASKDTMKNSTELVQKLETIFRGFKLHRLRVLAGYLLWKMEKLSTVDDKSGIDAIDPTEDSYILRSELTMLNELRASADLPQLQDHALELKAQNKKKEKLQHVNDKLRNSAGLSRHELKRKARDLQRENHFLVEDL